MKNEPKPKRGRPKSGKTVVSRSLTMSPANHDDLKMIVKAEDLKTSGAWVAKQIAKWKESQ